MIEKALSYPIYIASLLHGLVQAVFADIHVTVLALTGIAVGFAATSALVGISTFFVLYSISRIGANVADAIGHGLRAVAVSKSATKGCGGCGGKC